MQTMTAHAEPITAANGLDKIKTNVENSKANQKEYDRNLKVVNKNLNEVSKAKTTYLKQKETVSTEIVKNNESFAVFQLQRSSVSFRLRSLFSCLTMLFLQKLSCARPE